MTTQTKIKPQGSAGAQGAFQETQPKSKPKLMVDNTIQDREAEIAKKIANSNRPVIIITEANASRKNASYKMMRHALPNVPIIFENESAWSHFAKGNFVDYKSFGSCIGHFEAVTDYSSVTTDMCNELKKSDCVIVIGTPKTDLQNALDKHDGGYHINRSEINPDVAEPRVNFSAIQDVKKRNKNAWKLWRAKFR